MRRYHDEHPRIKGLPVNHTLSPSEAGMRGWLALQEKLRPQKEAAIKEWASADKKCPSCHTKIPFSKRLNTYCNRSCSNARLILIKICRTCGARIAGVGEFYCSGKCHQADVWKKTKEKIEQSGKLEFRDSGRRYLIEVRGHRCQICGISEWQKCPVPLILDHISGNSQDWSLSNLRMVCPNCDAQLPTYKGRNRGNGRFSRRIRYSEGKSY